MITNNETDWYCEICGKYATSKLNLEIHENRIGHYVRELWGIEDDIEETKRKYEDSTDLTYKNLYSYKIQRLQIRFTKNLKYLRIKVERKGSYFIYKSGYHNKLNEFQLNKK